MEGRVLSVFSDIFYDLQSYWYWHWFLLLDQKSSSIFFCQFKLTKIKILEVILKQIKEAKQKKKNWPTSEISKQLRMNKNKQR